MDCVRFYAGGAAVRFANPLGGTGLCPVPPKEKGGAFRRPALLIPLKNLEDAQIQLPAEPLQ